MKRNEIIELGRRAGFSDWAVGLSEMPSHLERFANLVAAAENEACKADTATLRDALNSVVYTMEKGKVWNGSSWEYYPLHPVHYMPVLEKVRALLKKEMK